ncbi:MAG: hypothetical protein ACPHET_07720, partial [Miltoncostaeaceae bacterium]
MIGTRRLLALGACGTGLLCAASLAVAPGMADPSARGIGAILPDGNVASAAASPRNPVRTAAAEPRGSVASGGRVSVRAAAGPRGGGHLAATIAEASGVSLIGGRVVVNSLRVGVRSDTGAEGTTAGVTEWAADIVVDGRAIEEQPGAPVEIPGLGTMVLVERLVTGGEVTANALRIEVSDPATGLAPGTQLVIGRVEAETGEVLPEPPSPDPGSAPSAPGAATPSADGAQPGAPLP